MEWIAVTAALVLFICFPKRMFIMIGFLAVMGGGVSGYFYYKDWKNEKETEAVSVIVEYPSDKCKEPYPLTIIIANRSSRIVTKIKWDIGVNVPGFSSELSKSSYHKYSQDKILKPNDGRWACVKIPQLKQDIKEFEKLNYSVINKYVSFQKNS